MKRLLIICMLVVLGNGVFGQGFTASERAKSADIHGLLHGVVRPL